MIVMPVAAVPDVVEFAAALICLFAVLAMLFDGDPQIIFCLVNVTVTSFVRPCGQGRANQANHRQQRDA
jgi:hypothetical protein